jgi:hypothetical protein
LGNLVGPKLKLTSILKLSDKKIKMTGKLQLTAAEKSLAELRKHINARNASK